MNVIHYSIIVKGKVQGVFFRKHAKEEADRIGVNGLVRNERDGSVYIEVEGVESRVESFINWCWKGSPSSVVEDVETRKGKVKGYKDFRVDR